MSDETYYSVLGISENATPPDIKTAYRTLIKQVHPDTLSSLSPYLKRMAEEKTKEMTEAYSVLSDSSKRRQYDKQLAEYRHQTAPGTPPQQAAPSQAYAGPYCNKCGTPLYGSGYCPNCDKMRQAVSTPPQRAKNWGSRHPVLVVFLGLLSFLTLVTLTTLLDSPSRSTSTVVAPNNSVPFSRTPIPASSNIAAYGNTKAIPALPKITVPSTTGMYVGTVHNRTANLTTAFSVRVEQNSLGILGGCADVQPPLYGSGSLRGEISGSHIDFSVANIRFQGDIQANIITGSYIVSKSDGGRESGDFHLTRKPGAYSKYRCTNGALTEVELSHANTANESAGVTPYPKPGSVHALVTSMFASLNKRCAFLPIDNYRRCNYGPETIAELKQGDRLKVLSRKTRAENGEEIYKVRTEQGWDGWIDSRSIIITEQ